MHKLFISLISYLIILSLLTQNFVWADGYTNLAPDSTEDLREITKTIGKKPDIGWARFNGIESGASGDKDARRMKFPSGISKEKLEAFWEKYGNFGVIEGIIGSESKEFIYDIHAQARCNIANIKNIHSFTAIIQRLNAIISKLELPSGTTIRLTSEGERPLLYHKDDEVLEIHAVLLTEQVDDKTLEFIARHEERHYLMQGLEPWLEELLNLYIDLIILQQSGENADRIVYALKDIEGENGYWKILAKRKDAIGDEIRQRDFFDTAVSHIAKYTSVPHYPFEFLEQEIVNGVSFLTALWKISHISQPELFLTAAGGGNPNPIQLLILTSQVLSVDIKLPKKILDIGMRVLGYINRSAEAVDILSLGLNNEWARVITQRLWKNNAFEEVLLDPDRRTFYLSCEMTKVLLKQRKLVAGYDDANKKIIYIPAELENKPWAKKFIKENILGVLWNVFFETYKEKRIAILETELQGITGSDRNEKRRKKEIEIENELRILQGIYSSCVQAKIDNQILIDNLGIAMEIIAIDVGFISVCAALTQNIGLEKIGFVSISSYQHKKQIAYILEQIKKIEEMPFLPLVGTKRSIQNHINMLIQLSTDIRGSPNHIILLLFILNKLNYIRKLAENNSLYEALSQEQKNYLEQDILMICAPLSEFMGLENIAAEIRDKWFKITHPAEYERIKHEIEQLFMMPMVLFGDLNASLENVRKDIEEGLLRQGLTGITVNVRMKSIYSIWEKIRSKGDIYPDIDSLHDVLGIQIIVPKSDVFDTEKDKIDEVLRNVFPIIENEDRKTTERHGYEEFDFIGLTEDHLKIEVQIYPSAKDYRSYKAGIKAHWVYKITRQYPGQEFDVELLERIQNKITGSFKENFYTIFNLLSEWIFAGVIIKDKRDRMRQKVHIARLGRGAIDADLASARRVNELDKNFIGVKEINGLRLIEGRLEAPVTQQRCKELKPGIFVIEKGVNNLDRFDAIRKSTNKIRAYLLASQIVDSRSKDTHKSDGKKMLLDALTFLGYKFDREMETNMLLSVAVVLGLADVDELYSLFYLITQHSEEAWFTKTCNQFLREIANEKSIKINNDDQVKAFLSERGYKVPKGANFKMVLLAYFATAPIRGKQILKDREIKYKDKNIRGKLELLLPEFGLNSLDHLYAKLGIYPDFIFNLLFRYSTAGLPAITYEIEEDKAGIINKILKIMDSEDVRCADITDEGNAITIYFYPPRALSISTIARMMDTIKEVLGIKRGSVKYIRANLGNIVNKNITISVPLDEKGRLLTAMADLMSEFKISFRLGEQRRIKATGIEQEFIIETSDHASMSILEEAIVNKLKSRSIRKFIIIRRENISIAEKTRHLSMILPDPYLLLVIGTVTAFWFLAKFVLKKLKENRLNKKCGKAEGTDGRTVDKPGLIFSEFIQRRNIFKRFYQFVTTIINKEGDVIGQITQKQGNPDAIAIRQISSENPWVLQAFFDEIVVERPKILLLDIDTATVLNDKGKQILTKLIEQVEGRVVMVSNTKGGIEAAKKNAVKSAEDLRHSLSGKTKARFDKGLQNIYVRENQTEYEFTQKIYAEIQRAFSVEQDEIMIFTSRESFVRLWRKIVRKSLFYLIDNDNLYITSEDLLVLQKITGNNEFDLRHGGKTKLLPEYYYTDEAFRALEHREAEQGA